MYVLHVGKWAHVHIHILIGIYMCVMCMIYIHFYYDKDDGNDDAYHYSRLDQKKILPIFFLCLHTEFLQIQRILLL